MPAQPDVIPAQAGIPDTAGGGTMKRWLWSIAGLLVLFLGLVAGSALLPESPERLVGSITNPRPQGVRALGEVLAANGVAVHQVTTLAEATATEGGSTLAVYLNSALSDAALAELRDVPADLVVIYAGDVYGVETLSDGRVSEDYWWSDEEPKADCADPDVEAAGTITSSSYGVMALDDSVTTCFISADGAALYADATTAQHRVTVIGGDEWLQNDTITDAGNAALALRVLGRHTQLTWYLPGPDARTTGTEAEGFDTFSLLPPWASVAAAMLVAAAAAAALWRGRRFGKLVPEALPVAVPASEAASGLARLYRQAGARGHASAALRAASIDRLAARLGIPTTATPDFVVERLGQASGLPAAQLRALFYGPPPNTDSELVALAAELTDFEGKLNHRD